MKRNTKTVILIIAALLIAFAPLFWLKGAEFIGSDNAGSEMVSEVAGTEYEPWIAGAEIPGEVETLFFCLQTGIGVGIIAYCFGYLSARRKYSGEKA